jgi:hypothetical protein
LFDNPVGSLLTIGWPLRDVSLQVSQKAWISIRNPCFFFF